MYAPLQYGGIGQQARLRDEQVGSIDEKGVVGLVQAGALLHDDIHFAQVKLPGQNAQQPSVSTTRMGPETVMAGACRSME